MKRDDMMRFLLKTSIVLLLVMGLSAFSGIYAEIGQNNTNTIYVSKTGSDDNNGLTSDKCKRTIQSAISNAKNYDTILIYPGTYKENININKNIILTSTNPKTTFIDGMKQDSCITVCSDCTISRLTIINGKAFHGGGINIISGRCNIKNCTIKRNVAEEEGGGICTKTFDGPLFLFIDNSDISDNEAVYGGGIFTHVNMNYNSPMNTGTIVNNTQIHSNTANIGGGIYNGGDTLLKNTLIKRNTANMGGGIYNGCAIFLINSKIQWNWALLSGGIYSKDSKNIKKPIYRDKETSVSFNWPYNVNAPLEDMDRSPYHF